jgi:hypothetical protein
MKTHLFAAALSATILLGGCASGLNSMEKRQYMAYGQQGVLVEEKNPTSGALLGLLPGGGSFYAREPALGVVNLLLWPISILWDPVSGYAGSRSINYAVTTYAQRSEKAEALDALADQLATGAIDSQQYLVEKQKITNEYDVN